MQDPSRLDSVISRPSATGEIVPISAPPAGATSAVLHRQIRHDFPAIVRGEGSYLVLDDGRRILDASGGAAVACIGHGDGRVADAAMEQMRSVAYCATIFYTNTACEQLCRYLVDSTGGHMARAYIVCSGSEAMEAAMKLARQYYLEKAQPEPRRTRFIARNQSYHGITLGALAVGGHKTRRQLFEPLMPQNVTRVSPCFAYRGKTANETDAAYVSRLAAELDAEFQRVGPDTVCAFVAEPVVGAALGSVPSVPGYFKAVQAVCRKYGALLILDEVMCGMGRTGTVHTWQQEGVAPDIQTIGKCLGGGYQPIAGVLASHGIIDVLSKGTGAFVHGHTYQGHPVACAAALAVQRIVAEEDLLANVRTLAPVLSGLLKQRLGDHPNVGDIRGRGFFWGIEFVQDKTTAQPFPAADHVAMEIAELGVAAADYAIAVYPGSGTVDGVSGDHIIISPPYNASRAEIHTIVDRVARGSSGSTPPWRRDASYGNSTSLAASLAPASPTTVIPKCSFSTNAAASSSSPLPSPRSPYSTSFASPSSPNTSNDRFASFASLTAASRRSSYLSSRIRMMAVGLTPSGTTASLGQRHAAEEEARAEVDVLSSRLEKTSQLTKKIEACLNRLDATGKSVREVAGPLSGETKRLQTLGNNIESVIAAIERLRQPAENKNEEELIIRAGPEKAGLPKYLSSVQRLDRSLNEMKASNLRSTQQTIGELQRIIMSANAQLESYFDQLLRAETPREIEPLHFVTKNKPFPLLSQDTTSRLGLINAHLTASMRNNNNSGTGGAGVGAGGSAGASMLSVGSGSQDSPVARIYADIRGPYMANTLKNLAAASVNTTKKKTADAIYRSGTSGIGMYAQSMEGMFLAEHENICSIFTRDDWGTVFQSACQNALNELARTLRELNSHIKAHPQTDCYLAYEVVEIVSGLSNQLDTRTGELKSALAASLKPVRDTAKSSLGELLEDTKRRVTAMPTLPLDGGPVPIVSETMQRLQTMVDFLRPISSIMISLGDGGWRAGAAPRGGGGGGAADAIPSLASFDVGADGREIFAHYCTDTLDGLLSALDARARASQGRKPVVGVFLANSIAIVERMIRDSDLAPLLESRQASVLEPWRKKATALYTETCKDVSMHLFDVIHTNRGGPGGGGGGGGGRPASGQNGIDSSSIVRGLSSKDKENIKGKFTAFNLSFDEMVAKHRSFSMEREVRQAFARDIQQMLEPLYNRFWDRYHEIDKGKGKYVKYDKASISAVFVSLY